MNKQKHITYYDFLRGIAILMVIGIHTYISTDFSNFENSVTIFFRQILNCAVPIFLALSGFFLGRKKFDNKNVLMSFWKKQITKVYIPCLIWSLPYFVLSILRGGKSAVYQLVMLVFCGCSIYYFIALIIQYYILLPILQKYSKSMLIASIIISGISIISITYLMAIKGLKIPLIMYAGPFTTWFVFYMIGIYYSKVTRNYTLSKAIILVVIGLILECFETYYLHQFHGGGVGIKLSSFIYSSGVILLMFSPKIVNKYKDNVFTSFIVFIGKISFGLYLIHCFIILIVNSIIPQISWLLSWLIVVILTTLFIVCCRKILPTNLNKYLGLI